MSKTEVKVRVDALWQRDLAEKKLNNLILLNQGCAL
jgi:hypothetical protein